MFVERDRYILNGKDTAMMMAAAALPFFFTAREKELYIYLIIYLLRYIITCAHSGLTVGGSHIIYLMYHVI